jgi:putative oxidoreductase
VIAASPQSTKGEIKVMPTLARQLSEWEPRVLSIVRIVAGLLFMEHGLSKLCNFPIPFPGGQPAMFQLLWFAGVIESVGGLLLALGLVIRPVALIMSGEMAIAYFYSHNPRGFYPLTNGGDAAILYCFIFLYFFVAGGGAWSLDRTVASRRS